MAKANNKVQTNVHPLYEETMKLDSTSKKIRFLASKGLATKEVTKLINEFGVTTKAGGQIIYQFVRNVLNQKVAN